MKHIALRAKSVRNPTRPFTTPGLGDRIHSLTAAWAYHKAHNIPVTIHLTKSKQVGGMYNNKTESWKELLLLFPEGSINIAYHAYEPKDEKDWIAYLKHKGFNAEIFWYKDHPGTYESREKLDISHYLKNIPLLEAAPVEIKLPDKFITTQWDSSEKSRTLSQQSIDEVMAKYRKQGYEVITVGGKSTDKNLNMSLKHIAYAMSKASLHVGVDSAFMHMAFLYQPFDRIHLYNEPAGFYSHHFRRAIDNGVSLNKYYLPVWLPGGPIV